MGYLDNAGLAHFWRNVRQYVDENQGTGGGSSDNQVWSRDETVIGTWIDGRPRYRMVAGFKSPSITIPAYTLGLVSMVNVKAFDVDPQTAFVRGNFMNMAFSGVYKSCAFDIVLMSGLLRIGAYNNSANDFTIPDGTFVLELEYCKTTDTSTT